MMDERPGAAHLEPADRRKEEARALARVRDLQVHADHDAAGPQHRPAPRRAVDGAHLVVEVAAAGDGGDGDAAAGWVDDAEEKALVERLDADLVALTEGGDAQRRVLLILVDELTKLDLAPLHCVVVAQHTQFARRA